MIKLLKDCMTRTGFWQDDCQVVSEQVEKFYSRDHEGVYIVIQSLEE